MPPRILTQIASQLRRERIPLDAAVETDRDLLHRFLHEHDEDAFESLVRRHDRLVRSTIAKVLSNAHDAEDAFQATFLVLVRRAKSIDWRTGLGPWLYGVAHRVAVKARGAGQTRTRKEKEASAAPGDRAAAPDLSWREACAVLHAELDKLPDRFRLPLLLCYLEGKTRDEAGAALRVAAGTIKGRLESGRKMLRARLARRGVTLSAGLLAAVTTEHAWAGSLSSIPAVLEAVRGSASARILALTQEATVTTILSKITTSLIVSVGLVVVASAVVASGAMRPTVEPGPPAGRLDKTRDPADEKAKAPTPTPKQPPTAPAAATVTIKGHLSGPDQAPEPGATVAVWGGGKKLGETTTTKLNVFQVTVPGPLPGGAKVVATKPGFAPDWANVPDDPANTSVDLRVVPDDTPIAGRVTDLEGRPVANLPVVIERVGRPMPGKTLDEHIKLASENRHSGLSSLSDLDSIPAEAAGLSTRIVTDKDGRFKITGIGADRAVRLTARGETTEHLQVRVVTRDLDAKLEQAGRYGLHGATFTMRLGQARPIVGTVRDAKTGAPVPGMKVADFGEMLCDATTDKDGQFKLFGVRKKSQYSMVTGSLGEAPYFDANVSVEDPPGLGAITVDFKVSRGIVVTGRVVDAAGKPVAGRVQHHWTSDNPHRKEYLESPFAGRITTGFRGNLDRDGRYRLLVIPGPGAISVHPSPEDAFPILDALPKDVSALKLPLRTLRVSAIGAVNADPKDPKTLTRDFTLDAGKTRELVIRGVDGKLPNKLLAAWRTERNGYPVAATTITGDTITLTGLSQKTVRVVVMIDEAQTVGAVATVTGDGERPATVTLEKLGSIKGRLFDADGKPAAGAEVRMWLHLDRNKYDNLPYEFFSTLGVNRIEQGAWTNFTSRTAKTDKDGRFTLTGVLPGQQYPMLAGFNAEKKGGELLHQNRAGVTVKAGETTDLGDLKPKK